MATLRARDQDQKQARKNTLMRSGWELFKEHGGQLPSVAQVVKKAGVAKGTFYLYFKTKEELFMELLANAVANFFTVINENLQQNRFDIDSFTDSFVSSVCADDVMVHLGYLISDILEKDAEQEVALKFKLQMVQNLFLLGENIANNIAAEIAKGKNYKAINAGDASRLMLRSYAAFVGIAQMIPPPGNPYLEIPQLQPVRLELETDTRAIVKALWYQALQP